MAQETIVFAQGIEMPSHIRALAESMKPAEFTLRSLPPTAKSAEIAAAMRDAEYLVGFLRFLPDEAYLDGSSSCRCPPPNDTYRGLSGRKPTRDAGPSRIRPGHRIGAWEFHAQGGGKVVRGKDRISFLLEHSHMPNRHGLTLRQR